MTHEEIFNKYVDAIRSYHAAGKSERIREVMDELRHFIIQNEAMGFDVKAKALLSDFPLFIISLDQACMAAAS